MTELTMGERAKLAATEAARGITALPEGALLQRLEELWIDGAVAGQGDQWLIQELGSVLTKIVVARLTGDPARVMAVVDEFAEKHVVVRGGNAQSSAVH